MNIEVNSHDWKSLDNEQKEKIEGIIASHFPESTIVPSDNVKKSEESIQHHVQAFSINGAICKAACGIAEAGAVAACSAISGGIGIAVCVAAAHAAGDYCRSRC